MCNTTLCFQTSYFAETDTTCSGDSTDFISIKADYCLTTASGNSTDDFYYDDYYRQFQSEYITCDSSAGTCLICILIIC